MRLKGLRTIEHADVPLAEVSGIAITTPDSERARIAAIGDRQSRLAWAEFRTDLRDLRWRIDNLPTELQRGAQWEAIAVDAVGRVVLLREKPAEVVALAEATLAVESRSALTVATPGPLTDAWNAGGSGPESLVLLGGSRLLVAREKDPTVFVEFGPGDDGSALATGSGGLGRAIAATWKPPPIDRPLRPSAEWWPDADFQHILRDLSDLAVGPDYQLYGLSDGSETIARVELNTASQKATVTAAWRLDSEAKNPEGLAFLPNGQPVLALDRKKSHINLLLLDTPIAAPDLPVGQP